MKLRSRSGKGTFWLTNLLLPPSVTTFWFPSTVLKYDVLSYRSSTCRKHSPVCIVVVPHLVMWGSHLLRDFVFDREEKEV